MNVTSLNARRASNVSIGAMTAEQLQDHASQLNHAYEGVTGAGLLRSMITQEFPDKIAVVSSFGAESAVLLHLVAEVNPATPVIFIDTGKLFGETLRYRDKLAKHLGLMDVRSIRPDPQEEARLDPKGILWNGDTEACCDFRKVRPLNRALEGFDAWVTGRKRFQSSERASIPSVEADRTHVKINPLAHWGEAEVTAYFEKHNLPPHPLVEDGYLSIGCMPCTDRVAPGADPRSGRWSGQDKTECGIHVPETFEGGEGI
ncbi:MAG: phosphoadenylyl-sulfate reductase [Alphaproteobacteria bacterium]